MKKISCPQCQKQTVYHTDNPFRPFCCERCKLIDLGEWANEDNKLPSSDPLTEEEILENFISSDDEDMSSMTGPNGWLH